MLHGEHNQRPDCSQILDSVDKWQLQDEVLQNLKLFDDIEQKLCEEKVFFLTFTKSKIANKALALDEKVPNETYSKSNVISTKDSYGLNKSKNIYRNQKTNSHQLVGSKNRANKRIAVKY